MLNTKTAITALTLAAAMGANAQNRAINGDFEAGDTSNWISFPTGDSSFDVTTDAASGMFAGRVVNLASGSSAVIKQGNLGVGSVVPGVAVNISFDAKGGGVNGGVIFAEFFSELDGGGTSAAEILGNAPLALTDQYQTFNFTTMTGPNVSGGITLQFAVVTGANVGSTAELFVDNVVITAIPAPASAALLGLGGLAAVRRRR